MPTSPRRRLPRALSLALIPLLAAAPCVASQPAPEAPEATPCWQRQQPERERARNLAREEGVAATPEGRREQLRDLLPPGDPLPAPRLKPTAPGR